MKTPASVLAAVIVGGTTAALGAIANGAPLRALLRQGDGLLTGTLGPRYPAILPVLLSLTINPWNRPGKSTRNAQQNSHS